MNSSLNFSSTEFDRLSSAFKDPAFRSLFKEYAQELSNPNNKIEFEQYLQQIEKQQSIKDYHNNNNNTSEPVLLRPHAVFCLKLCTSPIKIFLNFCTSELIQQAISTNNKKNNNNNSSGSHWSIPYSLTDKRLFQSNTKQKTVNNTD